MFILGSDVLLLQKHFSDWLDSIGPLIYNCDNCNSPAFYMGMTDIAVEGTWVNMDGTPVDYTNWAPG